MTVVLGIDPGSTYTGLAVVEWPTQGEFVIRRANLLHFTAIRLGDDPLWALHDHFEHPVNRQVYQLVRKIVVERVPKTARKDTGRQGVQGGLGWANGFMAGLAVATVRSGLAGGLPYGVVSYESAEPIVWRPFMLAASARAGKVIPPPRRAPGWTHDDVRNAWKAAACAFVAHAYPEPYKELVADARSRARTAKHDWELAGVPDACEAVGIAVYGLLDKGAPVGRPAGSSVKHSPGWAKYRQAQRAKG